jgi:hypothetical protein
MACVQSSVDAVLRISHIFIVVELVLIDLNIYRLNQDQNGKEKNNDADVLIVKTTVVSAVNNPFLAKMLIC